jgi:tetratricopeptide (TPR) repeat protein
MADQFRGRIIWTGPQQRADFTAPALLDEIATQLGRAELRTAQIDEAQRPRDVLAELRQGEGDAARRVFDRSFNLEQLGDDGRAALLSLSLFTPSASREALAQVAGFGDDLKRLNEAVRRLARLWLVIAKDGGERLAIEGLTREMARARINRLSNSDGFRQRFVACFLTYAESRCRPEPEDYDALEAERENALGAMDIAFEAQDWRTVMRLMNAINYDGVTGMLSVRGYWDEAKEYGKQALTAARKLQEDEGIAVYTGRIAIVYQNQGDIDEARALCQQSLDIARKLGDQHSIATSLHCLAAIAQVQGDIDEARALYQQSLDIRRKLGDQSGIASSLHQLGRLAEDKGDKVKAAPLFREALTIFEKLRSPNAEIARRSLERVEKQSIFDQAKEGILRWVKQ